MIFYRTIYSDYLADKCVCSCVNAGAVPLLVH